MPRVLQCVADGAPGGGTHHVLQLLHGLKSSFTLGLVTQGGSYLAQQAAAGGIPCFQGEFFRRSANWRAPRAIAAAIKSFQPDLVHCHGGRVGFFRSWLSDGLPTVYTVHGLHYSHKGPVSRLVGRWAQRRTMRSASRVLFVCQYDQQIAQRDRLFGSRTTWQIIYNGVPCPTVAPSQSGGAGEIGYIGRLVPQKHPELFVEMLAQLPGRRAVLVGDGPLQAEVARLAQKHGLAERLRCTGALAHRQALEILAGLDVLVMTSRWEGLPLLALEAMWLGVPVVSTAVGGVPEIIEARRTGMLAANETPEDLAATVKELDQFDELRGAITTAARQRVAEVFSEVTMIRSTADVYRNILALPGDATVPNVPTTHHHSF
jgi:glycosyltransferase involved in cell wall biosynthesis